MSTSSSFENARREAHEAVTLALQEESRAITYCVGWGVQHGQLEKAAYEADKAAHTAIDAACTAAREEGERKGRDEEAEDLLEYFKRVPKEDTAFKVIRMAIRRRIAAREKAAKREEK